MAEETKEHSFKDLKNNLLGLFGFGNDVKEIYDAIEKLDKEYITKFLNISKSFEKLNSDIKNLKENQKILEDRNKMIINKQNKLEKKLKYYSYILGFTIIVSFIMIYLLGVIK